MNVVQTWIGARDRSRWASGPWDDEPDKLSWIDEATGLDCLIVRNHMGGLCGYVGVPPEHPWHGVAYCEHLGEPCAEEYCYEHRPESLVSVHGGLTFSEFCAEHGDIGGSVCHVPAEGRPANVYWFGFDCAHHSDRQPGMAEYEGLSADEVYRDVAYVRAEIESLAAQLAEVSG